MTETLTCWNCGSENVAGAKFCANCGKPQKPSCPECGAEVAEGVKFCANCGIPLGAKTGPTVDSGSILTAEARKVITVIFVDMVGSTAVTERFDPEEAREIFGKFYTVVQHAVERFEGSVANLLGDGVLAVFGLPATHEDDPERAVRAGLAIRDAVPVLNEHLAATHGVQLAVRVGINTGEVVAASGSTFDRDFLVSDAVTTAARLQQTVPAGSVVVGERTHRLTRDAIEYRDLPPIQVKGKSAPLPAWGAVAPLPEPPEIRRMAAPLIGRHGELGLLRHLYQRSLDEGLVHLVTVLGQPGVGKSRLLREFLAEVRDTDPPPLVLRGRSVSFGGQIGYHALLDIVRAQAGLMDTDASEVVRAKLAEWLQAMLPGREELLEGLLLTFGAEDGASADPSQMRQRLFETWQTTLASLAAARPVIVAFEDLHWGDDGVLDLIEELSGGTEAVSVFLICLARPELLERRQRWGGGGRNATTLDLKPLRVQEAEQLVAALSSQGVATEMRQTIAQRAEGNPLFVEELVRMVLEGSGPGATIPDTVQAVITARIDRLPADERRVLQAAAVIGRTFWPSAVAPLVGQTEEETRKAVEALIGKELVVTRPHSAIAGEREYAFRHILTRDVAYGLLPKAQRHRAHALTARWIESRMGERVEEVIEILAEHLRQAGDDGRAAAYLYRAANKARRFYANADAVRLFDQALDSATGAGLPPQEIASLYLGRGEVYQLMSAYPAALADFERGLAAARQAADPGLEAVLEHHVGLIHHREIRLEEAEAHYTRAASLARQVGDRRIMGLSLVDLANVAWDRGKVEPDDPSLTEGIAILREVGDRQDLVRGLNLMCMVQFSAGDGSAAIAAAQEALAVAREVGDKSREATSLSYLSIVNLYLGRYRESVGHAEAALSLAREIGDRRRIAFAIDFIGRAKMFLGEWGEAIQLLEEALPQVREYAKIHLPFTLYALGMLYSELGDEVRARPRLAEGSTLQPTNPAWRQGVLLSAIRRAQLEQDEAALTKALDEILALPWNVFIPDDTEALLPVGEALLEAGRIDELRWFIAARREAVVKFGVPPNLDLLEAQLALHDARQDEALFHLDRAIRWSEAHENVLVGIRGREVRLRLLNLEEDREALRAILGRIAETLPDDLRETFLANPRAAILRDETAG